MNKKQDYRLGTHNARLPRHKLPPERRRFLNLQERAFNHVVNSSKIVLVLGLAIVFLQGFRLWGFNLSTAILYGLIGLTVGGELAKSFYVILRFLFGPGRRRSK